MFNEAGYFEFMRDKSLFYTSYKPSPLCTNNFINMDEELAYFLNNAHRAIGILEGIAKTLKDIDTYEGMFIKKEVLYSCILEKSDMELKDIVHTSRSKKPKVQEAINYIEATYFSKTILNNGEITDRYLYDLHNVLKGAAEKVTGYRNIPIFDSKALVTTNMNDYNPTAPEDILPVMEDLVQYINRDDGIDKLIKLSLIYYQFMTISPFKDENKKLSRMLINILLGKYSLLSKHLICMSWYMVTYDREFKDRMQAVRLFCSYRGFVLEFLKGIIVCAEKSIDNITKLMELKTKDETKIANSIKNIKLGVKFLEYLRDKPIIDIKDISEKLNISYNTAAQMIEDMQNLEILRKSNKLSRNRSFEYKEYLEILDFNKGGE